MVICLSRNSVFSTFPGFVITVLYTGVEFYSSFALLTLNGIRSTDDSYQNEGHDVQQLKNNCANLCLQQLPFFLRIESSNIQKSVNLLQDSPPFNLAILAFTSPSFPISR